MSLILLILLILPLLVSSESPRHQDVDHIENIEVEQTQVIITTTKEGNSEVFSSEFRII